MRGFPAGPLSPGRPPARSPCPARFIPQPTLPCSPRPAASHRAGRRTQGRRGGLAASGDPPADAPPPGRRPFCCAGEPEGCSGSQRRGGTTCHGRGTVGEAVQRIPRSASRGPGRGARCSRGTSFMPSALEVMLELVHEDVGIRNRNNRLALGQVTTHHALSVRDILQTKAAEEFHLGLRAHQHGHRTDLERALVGRGIRDSGHGPPFRGAPGQHRDHEAGQQHAHRRGGGSRPRRRPRGRRRMRGERRPVAGGRPEFAALSRPMSRHAHVVRRRASGDPVPIRRSTSPRPPLKLSPAKGPPGTVPATPPPNLTLRKAMDVPGADPSLGRSSVFAGRWGTFGFCGENGASERWLTPYDVAAGLPRRREAMRGIRSVPRARPAGGGSEGLSLSKGGEGQGEGEPATPPHGERPAPRVRRRKAHGGSGFGSAQRPRRACRASRAAASSSRCSAGGAPLQRCGSAQA